MPIWVLVILIVLAVFGVIYIFRGRGRV